MKTITLEPPKKKEVRKSSALVPSPIHVQKDEHAKMRYRDLLEAAPDAIVVVNPSGKIVLVNAQAERLFGYRRDELVGRPSEILVSEHFRRQHTDQRSRFQVALPDRPAVAGLELFGLRKDGTEFPAEIRLSPLDTNQGILVSSAIRDISARRRTEEDLRRLASIVICSDDAIVGQSLEGMITSWNAGAERMYGYVAREAIGQPVAMLVPADRREEIPKMMERLKHGEIVDHFETLCVRRDGKEFFIEVTASPIRDAAERIVGASTIGRDISVRKAAEKHVIHMEARYRGLLEAAPDAMVIVNHAGEIVLLNVQAEKQFGYRRDELVGQKVKNIIPEGFAERLIADGTRTAAEALAQQIGTGIELYGRRKDGTDFPIEIMLSPLESAEGILVTAAIRDITERKRMEEMLFHSQRMEAVGRLAGGIAHDFNNLLGVILGYTEILLESLGLNDTQCRDIGEIQKAGERAALLTRQLLAFSRKQVLQPKVLDLNAVMAGAEKLLQRLIGEDIELLFAPKPGLGHIRADPGQIEQIIMNLAVNARDAMPTGGKLTIETANIELDNEYTLQHSATRTGMHVMLSVTDTGCGMDVEIRDRIFEPFFTTKEFGKGTGLGLSTVYGIVKQSGGSVWVYSEPGIGSTFKIYFPCVTSFLENSSLAEDAVKADKGSQTILVVEDDSALLKITRRCLQDVGYAILAARNPAEAIHISEDHPGPIHLMVTDVIMPGMSGDKLAARLSPLRPEMKVLYVSGYTDDAIVHHGVLEPGLEFLQKPFSPKSLARKVAEVLAPPLIQQNQTIHKK